MGVKYVFQFKRMTALEWATANPILNPGEPGLESDTGFMKIGLPGLDGTGRNWNDVPYQNGLGVTGDLANLTDVTLTSVATNDLIQYSAGKWINRSLSAAGIAPLVHNHDTDYYKKDEVTSIVSAAVPAGVISQFAGSTAPAGYLLCTGQELAIASYGALYAVLGTTYGSLTNGSGGAGTTHFRLPNLQGKIPVAKGSGTFSTLGSTGGTESVQIGADNLPAHSHPNSLSNNTVASSGHQHYSTYSIGLNSGTLIAIAPDNGSADIWGPTDYGGYIQSGHASGLSNSSNTYEVHRSTSSGPTASTTVGLSNANNVTNNTAITNLQPYIVVNYIIKT